MKFAVVLVTYNRLECLKIALKKYEMQTLVPAYLFVVNNASTDGTGEFLRQWVEKKNTAFEKVVMNVENNSGGAGGFALGVERALQTECDFLFLADDDAYAEENTLSELANAYARSCNQEEVSALCTAIFRYGKLDTTQRGHIHKTAYKVEFHVTTEAEYTEPFRVDTLSFVGAALKCEAVRRIGLPLKEYFIHFDDVEYSMRLARVGDIYCVPSSIMNHDTEETVKITWKNYYGLRNEIVSIKKHYPKRYYYFLILDKYIRLCSFAARILKNRTSGQIRMYKAAIRDAIVGCMGMSKEYKPGTDIEAMKP